MEDVQKVENPKAALEAILFTMGSSVDLASLSMATGLGKEETREHLSELAASYESEDRGIRLIVLEDAYQLCTKRDYYDCLIRLAMHPKKPVLTDVMLETLSIIAYKQPVTRAEIERIRGVKSDSSVSRLVEAGLIRELGRLDAPGRPILFGTTEEFLRIFGVEKIDDLPMADPVALEDFKAEAEKEAGMEFTAQD